MKERKSIKFHVSDNFSGINHYSATINEEWVLMEYDPKNNLLEHFFVEKETNEKKKLVLTISDGLGNKNKKEVQFIR